MNRHPLSRRLPLAGAAVALLAVTACGSGVTEADDEQPATEQAAAPAEVTNCGRDLSVTAAPESLVGLSPAQTELLMRLGLTDRVVGQAQVANAPLPDDLRQAADGIPVLSEDTPPSREVLLQAGPDFVFAPTAYEFTAEQGFASLEQLDQAGVTAYIATGGCPDRRMTGTVDDLFTDLDNLGLLLGGEEEAAALAAETRDTLDDVTERVSAAEPVSVAQVYVEGTTLTAIGAGLEYDIIRRAGGANVFGPDDAAFAEFFAAQINPEELAERDPAALVFSVNSDEHEQATRDYLTRTFPDLRAVRDGRLIAVEASDVFPGTLGNVEAVADIARGLHPDAF